MRSFFGALALCAGGHSTAQYWAPGDLPVYVDGQLSQFYSDEGNNIFCICGRTQVPEGAPSPWRNGLVCHINGAWDTLGIFDGEVTCAVQYGDTLFVTGHFEGVDGLPLGEILGYVNGQWLSFSEPENAGAFMLRLINGELFRLGGGPTLHGVPASGVSKRSGGLWVPVGNLPPPSSTGGHQLFDIIEHNGQLVITGNINTDVGNDVFVLQGDDWVPLGGGLVGWNSFGKRLTEYQGDLYVGGGMSMADGDVGQNIVRWDGSQWHPVGSGLQVQLNNFGAYGTVEDMLVHQDELFVCGGFRYAGGIYAKCVARWNGSQWCSVGGDTGDYIFCMGFFQDTLLVNSQTLGHIAQFVAPGYENNCGLWAGVQEHRADGHSLRAWQDGDAIVVEGLTVGSHRVLILDAAGRAVGYERATSDGSRTLLRKRTLADGAYTIVVPEIGVCARLVITH